MSRPHAFVVCFEDEQGMPRAFASGKDKQAVIATAEKHLALYRKEKAKLGDPLAYARYTMKVRLVGGEDDKPK